jgi:hypothetical protein
MLGNVLVSPLGGDLANAPDIAEVCVCMCIATLLCVFQVDLLKCYYYIKAFVSIIMGVANL